MQRQKRQPVQRIGIIFKKKTGKSIEGMDKKGIQGIYFPRRKDMTIDY